VSTLSQQVREAWHRSDVARYFPASGPAGLPLARRPRLANLNLHMALATAPVLPFWLLNTGSQLGVSWQAAFWQFLPLLLACLLALVAVETVFAVICRRSIEPGWYLPSWLFALLVPATAPPLQAATAIALGVLLGRLVFGGAVKYFVSPALLGALFLYTGHPEVFEFSTFNETTALASLVAALYLAATGTVSWRILLGGVAGVLLAAGLVATTGAEPVMTWYQHLSVGAFAFGLVFLAGEPGCAPLTPGGRWFLGIMAGSLTVLIRSFDPAHPDGVLHAILLAALFAPLADWLTVKQTMARRKRREEAWP
jgi:Na+-transporting NADH:ubiquinone oxidoreductase subunit B